uniref:Uncharacterized protein n=1 Tax=Anopheles minimus TaxID=112268 RepID=A0A182WN95_9DIPT
LLVSFFFGCTYKQHHHISIVQDSRGGGCRDRDGADVVGCVVSRYLWGPGCFWCVIHLLCWGL